ncbi:ATP-binding cassette domain-containing protein [uncultured Oxalicibacterium sp.]|uniref:peptidase domain-containing ABC transporter n=1 Tax=uncultured Oxalicibacterium sp. TaxID=1168540 RepID=UPI0025DF4137|nr:ATP-binding cassette domain-containing protein [uncultured Oxalicibacterium sp.]
MSQIPDLPASALPPAEAAAAAATAGMRPKGELRELVGELTRDPLYVTMLRAYGKRLVEIVVAGLLINLFGLLMPLYSRLVYDKVIGNHITETLWALTIGMLLFVVLEFVLRVIRTYYVEQLAGKFDLEFDHAVVQKLLAARVTWPVGVVLARYRDMASARDLLSSNYMLVIIDLPFLLLYLVALGLIGGSIAWVVLVGGGFLLLAQWLCKIPAMDYGRMAMTTGAAKTDKLAGLVFGVETLRTSPLQKRILGLFSADAEESAVVQAKGRFWSVVGYTISNFSYALITVGVLVVGVYLVEDGGLTVGALIASSMLASRAGSMLSSVATVATRIDAFRQAKTAFESLFVGTSDIDSASGEVERERIDGRIQVNGLAYSVRPGEPAMLKQLSFAIQPGEKVGIVGRSGSGKSTLLRCLAGVYRADAGHVLYDGVALAAYPDAVRMRAIGYKPQEPFLFDGTLASNIFAEDMISTRVYQTALAVSGMDELIAGGSLRLDQLVTAPGNLSGGQRQMVALARTIAGMPNVLLLDEPTTGIDQASEARIVDRLLQFSENRTLIVATHSPLLLRRMDRIIVLDDGKIITDGPRAQILQ